MALTGKCYCGAVNYEITGDAMMQAQCHCRECQYISGGSPNVFMLVKSDQYKITKGETASFTRDDLDAPATREFCPNCGTSLFTRPGGMPDAMAVKVGTLDTPAAFTPQMAIFTCDAQSFHQVPEGIPSFEKVPG